MDRLLGCSISGHGPGVVLLHSSMSTRGQWRKLAADLARDHKVLAIDLIGYGESPPPSNPAAFSLADEAERVVAYADHCFGRGAPFLLAGHSYGGATALHIAREYPRRVSALALFEPVCFNLLDDEYGHELVRRLANAVNALTAAGRQRQAARAFFDFWNGADSFSALPAALQATFASVAPKVALDFQALRLEPASLAAYTDIAAPTLLLGGERSSGITRRIVERLGAALPQCATGWVDGDHMAPASAPDRVNPLIAQFLRNTQQSELAMAA